MLNVEYVALKFRDVGSWLHIVSVGIEGFNEFSWYFSQN